MCVFYYAVSAADWRLEVEKIGVVKDLVDHRGRDNLVAEDLVPPPE